MGAIAWSVAIAAMANTVAPPAIRVDVIGAYEALRWPLGRVSEKRARLSALQGGIGGNGPRGGLPTRPSRNASVGLTLLLLKEGLGVESVGRTSDPGKNRQGDQKRYDRLHKPALQMRDPDNTIVDRNRGKDLWRASQ